MALSLKNPDTYLMLLQILLILGIKLPRETFQRCILNNREIFHRAAKVVHAHKPQKPSQQLARASKTGFQPKISTVLQIGSIKRCAGK